MGLFDEYKKHPNEYVQERADSWCIAIGFQNVDGLNVSDYLIQLAWQQIDGKISIEEVIQKIKEHYNHSKSYTSTYTTGSKMSKRIKEENKLIRPKMYE